MAAKLDKKRAQLYADQHDLYNNHYHIGSNPDSKIATFEGHVDQIIALQRGLDRAIKEAKDAGCL
ncbi:hypothetical protein [Andreprevotia chitinilytica]|uniref:hypothetical protein n=1 Tax=Andreprevotia chitinilytica TaxID=396808 RepID=UPI0012EC898C|nr:hypothetical protein [Andreprevotia chitinilytica]